MAPMGDAARILVVDDDPHIVRFVRIALELEGYTVQTAENGYDALAQVEQGLPGLPAVVLTDLRMPEMDGWEFVRTFRTRWGPEVPVVIMSATVNPVPWGKLLNAAAVLSKPFDLDTLFTTLDRLLPSPAVQAAADTRGNPD